MAVGFSGFVLRQSLRVYPIFTLISNLRWAPCLSLLNAEVIAQQLSFLIKYLVGHVAQGRALRRWKQVTLSDPEFKASLGLRP